MTMRVPIDIHEATVQQHLAREPRTGKPVHDPVIDGLAQSVTAAREAAEALASLANTPDPAQTPAQKALLLRQHAMKIGEAHTRRLDTSHRNARNEVEAIAKTIHAPAPIDATLAAEIRSTLKAMTPDERRETLQRAQSAGDDVTMAALLLAPAFLSGMNEETLSAFRLEWQRTRHPAEFERMTRLTKAVEAHERAARSFLKVITTTAKAGEELASMQGRALDAVNKAQGVSA